MIFFLFPSVVEGKLPLAILLDLDFFFFSFPLKSCTIQRQEVLESFWIQFIEGA